ncbi:hypothetical protein D9M68_920710 [compost metagenome]
MLMDDCRSMAGGAGKLFVPDPDLAWRRCVKDGNEAPIPALQAVLFQGVVYDPSHPSTGRSHARGGLRPGAVGVRPHY